MNDDVASGGKRYYLKVPTALKDYILTENVETVEYYD